MAARRSRVIHLGRGYCSPCLSIVVTSVLLLLVVIVENFFDGLRVDSLELIDDPAFTLGRIGLTLANGFLALTDLLLAVGHLQLTPKDAFNAVLQPGRVVGLDLLDNLDLLDDSVSGSRRSRGRCALDDRDGRSGFDNFLDHGSTAHRAGDFPTCWTSSEKIGLAPGDFGFTEGDFGLTGNKVMAPLGSEVAPERVASTGVLTVGRDLWDVVIPCRSRKNGASTARGKGEHNRQDGEDQGKDKKKGRGGDRAVMMS